MSLTIDLARYQDTIPFLQELGLIDKPSFEERFEKALFIEEDREITF